MLIVEEDERKPDDWNLSLSGFSDVSEHEVYGSGDEDEYVHVPPDSPRNSPRGRRP